MNNLGRFRGSATAIICGLILFTSVQLTGQAVDLPPNFYTYTLENVDNPDPGYIFTFIRPQAPKYPGYLMIIDNYGTPLYYKYLPYQSGTFTVQRSGLISFLSTEDGDSRIYMMDSSYRVVDSVRMETYKLDTHDFLAMENGHFLLFGLDIRAMDLSAVVEGGNPAATVKGCVIQELDADKNVVFEWNSFDHYEITDTYKDLSESSIDYVHPNSLEIDYDGNILLLARAMNEITKIDRQTGEIIWRLGGKNNDFDFSDTSHVFSMPHDFRLLANGNYTIFDNGNNRDPAYSRAVEYHLDEANKTIEMVWEYDADSTIFGSSGGSTRRLPSGNTLLGYGGKISESAAREVHPDGTLALELSFDNNMKSGRVLKFPWKTTLFEPAVESVNFGEWDGYTEKVYLLSVKNNSEKDLDITSVALHGEAFNVDEELPFTIPAKTARFMKVVLFPEGSPEGSVYSDILTLNADRDSTERIAVQVKLEGYYPDVTSPVVSFSPGGDTIKTNEEFLVSFNESVRMVDNSDLTNENVDEVIVFREDDESGADVAVTLRVNEEKTAITIVALNELESLRSYYLGIEPVLEDHADNTILAVNKTYTTIPHVGFDPVQTDRAFVVYPNPVKDVLHIKRDSESGSFDLTVYSVTGKAIQHCTSLSKKTYQMDFSPMFSGLYVLKIQHCATKKTQFIKVIKE